MRTTIMLLTIVTSVAALSAVYDVSDDAMAQPSYYPSVTSTQINDEISIQKTDVILSVPLDNALPWGFVTGQAPDNYIPDYPVIIQFYKDAEPVHFAQVDINDGSYEYKFRALSVDHQTGQTTHVFEGDYTVSIFVVISNTTSGEDLSVETI